MISLSSNKIFRMLVELVLLALLTIVISAALFGVHAQTVRRDAQNQPAVGAADIPALREYKGVSIGMTQAEARAKLGEPADKSDAQDYYSFSEQETAQVFYDTAHKVKAVSVTFIGASAPTAEAVLGVAVERTPDGAAYKLVKYPKAGYWISYSRTAGDAPIVTVVMQKL